VKCAMMEKDLRKGVDEWLLKEKTDLTQDEEE